ncbi:MAG TPA: peptidylprolyl isomerase, partial [Euryarchaeota archaeon]|nr:peptidylprolyl isomerase [Euryarchaeota archaeon]
MIAGAGRFLRGIEEALIGMREGEEKLIDVPPEK